MDQITQEETARLASSSNPRKCCKVRKLAEKNRENGFGQIVKLLFGLSGRGHLRMDLGMFF